MLISFLMNTNIFTKIHDPIELTNNNCMFNIPNNVFFECNASINSVSAKGNANEKKDYCALSYNEKCKLSILFDYINNDEINHSDIKSSYIANILRKFISSYYDITNCNTFINPHINDECNNENYKFDYQRYKNMHNNSIIVKNDNIIIIKMKTMMDNLRHVDIIIDRILHTINSIVICNNTYKPLFITYNSIEYIPYFVQNQITKNSFIKSFDLINNYMFNNSNNINDMNNNKQIIIYRNHIGSYLVLFNYESIWLFYLNDKIYECKTENHPIFFEYINKHLNELDVNLVYHILLIDNRLNDLFVPNTNNNNNNNKYENKNCMIILNITERYELNNIIIEYDFFEKNEILNIDSYSELIKELDELEQCNSLYRKMIYRGFILKFNVDQYDDIYIALDTQTYAKLKSMYSNELKQNEVYLYLYQQNKLNYFLQYFMNDYHHITKRLNNTINTISHEILDIYHLTRKKQNSELYNILPQSYKHILYLLHSEYISKKNNYYNYENDKIDNFSVSVDNVYNKIKIIDIYLLLDIYRDRIKLINDLDNKNFKNKYANLIRDCMDTKIQTKLLRLS